MPFYQTAEGKDLLPPRLTSEGARVDPDWLLEVSARSVVEWREDSCTGSEQINAVDAEACRVEFTVRDCCSNDVVQKLKAAAWVSIETVCVRISTSECQRSTFSPNELQVLVRFFMAMSGQQDPYIKEPLEPLTDQEKLTARQMFTSGTPCLKCHVTGDPTHDAKAIAPNFLLASERLKPDWTFRWLLDPSQIAPGTAMPSGLFKKEGDRWVINRAQSAGQCECFPARSRAVAGSLHVPDESRMNSVHCWRCSPSSS